MMWLILVLTLFSIQFSSELAPNTKQNFCQNDRCLTCVGRYCTTTCQGPSCKDCPLGDCCNGENCNICRGEICCKNSECNNCVNTCLKKCQGVSTCHFDCFQECVPEADFNKTQGGKGHIVSNVNYLPVNVTTIINITNTINNKHELHNPIYINTTNLNNMTSSGRGTYHERKVIINNKATNKKVTNGINNTVIDNKGLDRTSKYNCCEIIHPEVCRNISGQDRLLCYTGRHRECSELCTSKHIHFVKSGNDIKCFNIAQPPFYFCGNYVTQDCDSCYECESADKEECKTTYCSDTCKASLMNDNYYNTLYWKE